MVKRTTYRLYGSIRMTRGTSEASTQAVCRRPRFRLVVLLVRMCCLDALLRTTLPVEVLVNRFAAPRCVFNFGIAWFLLSASLYRPFFPAVLLVKIVCI